MGWIDVHTIILLAMIINGAAVGFASYQERRNSTELRLLQKEVAALNSRLDRYAA